MRLTPLMVAITLTDKSGEVHSVCLLCQPPNNWNLDPHAQVKTFVLTFPTPNFEAPTNSIPHKNPPTPYRSICPLTQVNRRTAPTFDADHRLRFRLASHVTQ